jgi:large subunit ribosomal protein L3
LKEFRLAKAEELGELKPGVKIPVQQLFKVGQRVDVQGVTIGKGFAGVIKRYHFGGQNASHGNSISHRVPGSTGQNQSPARVFPGKRMAGQLGNVRRTIPNLEIVRIDAERQLLLVKGSVPGSNGRDVVVRLAAKGQRVPVKAQAPKAAPKGAPKAEPRAEAKPAAAKPAVKQPAPKA